MLVEQVIKELIPKIDGALEFLNDELATIHTGRASTNMVESILIDVYGSKQSIKQIASITIPESRQILIHPWDKAITGQIESAIRDSSLGLSPVNTGDAIRVNIPELTEDRRKEISKIAKEKSEDARVSIRNSRTEAWNAVKKAKSTSEIGEDEMYRGEHRIQEEVDKANHRVEETLDRKEKELMEI